MGMFDDLRCNYPLPVAGANDRWYQTKDTPSQNLYKYEITAEGVLRHKEWNPDEGLKEEWIGHPDFTGEVRFYDVEDDGGWIEFSAYFVNGILKELSLIENTTRPTPDGPNARVVGLDASAACGESHTNDGLEGAATARKP